mmetsp:Transcript_42119/g.101297  ORF Transcript_42119/g.101297 Transcript_42119/m.101297 type:complete len:111 (+) Transcript_42119:808-1140(+)
MSRRRELELDADLEENDVEDTVPVLVPGDGNDSSISMTASDGGEVDIDDTASTVSGTQLFLVTVLSHRALPPPPAPPPTTKPPKSDDRRAIGSADDDDDDQRHDLDLPGC